MIQIEKFTNKNKKWRGSRAYFVVNDWVRWNEVKVIDERHVKMAEKKRNLLHIEQTIKTDIYFVCWWTDTCVYFPFDVWMVVKKKLIKYIVHLGVCNDDEGNCISKCSKSIFYFGFVRLHLLGLCYIIVDAVDILVLYAYSREIFPSISISDHLFNPAAIVFYLIPH